MHYLVWFGTIINGPEENRSDTVCGKRTVTPKIHLLNFDKMLFVKNRKIIFKETFCHTEFESK